MFTLFVLEHNAVCGALKRAYPGWTDEELYQRARLIISALIAKIHNAEWTPAMMGKARFILGLSGGSYIAASRALVARGLEPGRGRSRRGPGRIAPYAAGSPEEQHLRDKSRYLAPDAKLTFAQMWYQEAPQFGLPQLGQEQF